MSKLTNRFELRLSDEHSRRLKAIMDRCKSPSKSDTVRKLIDDETNEPRL